MKIILTRRHHGDTYAVGDLDVPIGSLVTTYLCRYVTSLEDLT